MFLIAIGICFVVLTIVGVANFILITMIERTSR
jgi:hypothetical protein